MSSSVGTPKLERHVRGGRSSKPRGPIKTYVQKNVAEWLASNAIKSVSLCACVYAWCARVSVCVYVFVRMCVMCLCVYVCMCA